jgi:hypothetical protein
MSDETAVGMWATRPFHLTGRLHPAEVGTAVGEICKPGSARPRTTIAASRTQVAFPRSGRLRSRSATRTRRNCRNDCGQFVLSSPRLIGQHVPLRACVVNKASESDCGQDVHRQYSSPENDLGCAPIARP